MENEVTLLQAENLYLQILWAEQKNFLVFANLAKRCPTGCTDVYSQFPL